MRDEVVSSSGAQNMDTSGYELSDGDDIEFFWQNRQLVVIAVSTPAIEIHFLPSAFDSFEKGVSAKIFIPLNEEDKENNL